MGIEPAIQIYQSGTTVYIVYPAHPDWVAVVSPANMSREYGTVKTDECMAWRPVVELAEATKLLEYALHLRMYGERAPGGNETWREFDLWCESWLRRDGQEKENRHDRH